MPETGPAARRHEGFTGTEAECGEHIDEALDRHAPRPAGTAATNLKARS